MQLVSALIVWSVAALLTIPGSAAAQTSRGQAERRVMQRVNPLPELPVRDKLNAWTVGLAGGLLEGAPIRFATEIARVVDDGDNLHVLPIVTRGPAAAFPRRGQGVS